MAEEKSKYDPELLRGNTDSLLLFLIDEHGSTYGYRLIKEIERRSGGYFQFREGTVYPALRRLENDGLVRGDWRTLPSGQQRRYYRITERGQEALRSKLAMWHSFTSAIELILRPAPEPT